MSLLRYERPIVVDSVRSLIAAAQATRAARPADSADRRFYQGVEAAALELLHPEVGQSHDEKWLERQAASFREGYVRTRAMFAAAMTSDSWPSSLPLPHPAAVMQ
jgi:hypothetical protein